MWKRTKIDGKVNATKMNQLNWFLTIFERMCIAQCKLIEFKFFFFILVKLVVLCVALAVCSSVVESKRNQDPPIGMCILSASCHLFHAIFIHTKKKLFAQQAVMKMMAAAMIVQLARNTVYFKHPTEHLVHASFNATMDSKRCTIAA